MMRASLLFVLLAACSNEKPKSCTGTTPSLALIEAYCKNGEADRCYYTSQPLDGF
jgi:hypothetical protein